MMYYATISGQKVYYEESLVPWETLRDDLCKAAGLPKDKWQFYVPKENKSNVEMGDHFYRHDLSHPKDYILIEYAYIHRNGYKESTELTV